MVESLEEFKAGRKSKSLEESKNLLNNLPKNNQDLLMINGNGSVIAHSETGQIGKLTKWQKRYTSLTEYDKKRHDGVKAFVEALRRLEEKGIFKHCGRN